ncbi:FMN-linked oxidoreductase [Armillaria solidipes]|uniref:FMN-linked oxidoreductase n=1 Tax=Armillaria solidipes TaxID=1076256 RepID=A0A2H3BV99_9AGAR|nr:FMN-linked oxidoreductase [Armillaria solidipes]
MSAPTSLQALFQPLQLGPLTLKNRVFMSALTRNRSVPTNVPNEINVEYYRQRAAGGAGLIVAEGILIGQQGSEWQNAPGIWSKEQVLEWTKITDAVHAEGSLIYAQLWHLGRVSHPDAPEQIASGQPVYAPSAISARGGKFRFLPGQPGYVTPTVIDDPRKLLPAWKQAALNAKEAGFDGVEIHGANGYIIHQFLDNTSNHRTDEWGSSIENRSRFGLEVVKILVDVWGADRVAIKLSPAGGYNDQGMPLKETIDTFTYFINELDKLKIAYVTLVRWTEYFDAIIDGSPRATKHDIVATYAPLLKNVKAFANAGFTGEEAARYIEQGKVAGVFFGLPWIAHPDFAKRLQYGKPLDGKLDITTLYGHGRDMEAEKKGYIDYPPAEY